MQMQIVFQTRNPSRLADFWRHALRYVREPPPDGYATWDDFAKQAGVDLTDANVDAAVDPFGCGPRLLFERVENPTIGNAVHLDINVATRAQAVDDARVTIDVEVANRRGGTNHIMTVTTTTLTIDEWPKWRSLRLATLADAPEAFGSRLSDWADAPDQRWRSRLRDVPLNVIAMLDNKSVGQVSATNDGSSTSVELISMWVAPNARGAGVGDAMIHAVISWAEDQGASVVELSVKAANLPARRLYERNRFLFNGNRDQADEVRMIRTLP